VTITLHAVADLTADERAELRALSDAVYPPAVVAAWPGRALEWSPPGWSVIVRDAGGRAVCHAGVVVRTARADGRAVRVGGIGGVKTHPAARGQGHAAAAIRRALDFLRDGAGVAFGLLVCEPDLIPYYERLGWRPFPGALVVAQRGATVPFTFNLPMTTPVRSDPPPGGTIDLLGPPW
jgi:GNAT superfamily N-acetyltransferase